MEQLVSQSSWDSSPAWLARHFSATLAREVFWLDCRGTGEPAIVFPDGFGVGYFYHGIELPQYCGTLPSGHCSSDTLRFPEGSKTSPQNRLLPCARSSSVGPSVPA